jgi:hypothetical protein
MTYDERASALVPWFCHFQIDVFSLKRRRGQINEEQLKKTENSVRTRVKVTEQIQRISYQLRAS